jgi:hypothetical protein
MMETGATPFLRAMSAKPLPSLQNHSLWAMVRAGHLRADRGLLPTRPQGSGDEEVVKKPAAIPGAGIRPAPRKTARL